MASPYINSYAVSGSGVTTATSHDITMPATVASGDLLLVIMCSDGAADDDSMPVGWTREAYSSYSGHSIAVFTKTAVGTEGGTTVTGTTVSPELTAHISLAIKDWLDFEISSVANNASVNPDSPELTASWGATSNLWISICGGNLDKTISSYPSGYTDDNYYQQAAGAGGCFAACASKETGGATENPGSFTINESTDWSAWTVVLKGSPSATTSASFLLNFI